MPGLARLYIRTSLVYLGLGGPLGGLLLWNKGVPFAGGAWALLGPHAVLMVWGWLLQLTFGVAYWILPRVAGERPRPWLAALAYGCLNAGLLFAAAAPWLSGQPGFIGAAATGWLRPLAGALQLAAGAAFARHLWPRVRATSPEAH